MDRFAELDARYREPHRAYHTWTHIRECLDVWDRCTEEASSEHALAFAIWLHDAIYRPLRPDNEERSAALAVEWLQGCASSSVEEHTVSELILATRHPAEPKTSDEALLQDIDLHILGAVPHRYAEYEAQIRAEYRVVPWPIYRRRRARLLQAFRESDPLFKTPWFRERFEDAAHRNLESALANLR